MSIKYKNSKGLNEKKSSQSSMNTGGLSVHDEFKEEYFEGDDQEQVENSSGEQGQTSGDSFDKNVKD